MNVSNIKVGAYNFAIITIIAILGIALAKMLIGKFPIPGVSEVVQAV
jgi:hypothetical protein